MVDIDTIRSSWRSRGFSCDIWTDPPGQVWEDYRHTVDELVMVLEGNVEFEINETVLQPAIGEELFIPAGALHSVRNKARTISRWLYGYSANNPR
jgi:quercetin dioxygenase-like cupin family protein